MISRPLLLLLGSLALGSSACKSEPVEPAPLEGGETLTYKSGATTATLILEKTDTGFTITTSPPGWEPQKVAANLRDGRKPVLAMDVALLWLEPAQRVIGGKTPLGNVIAEETRLGRPALKMSERNGQIEYWFSKDTGFLLERRVNPAGPSVQLVASTVPGL